MIFKKEIFAVSHIPFCFFLIKKIPFLLVFLFSWGYSFSPVDSPIAQNNTIKKKETSFNSKLIIHISEGATLINNDIISNAVIIKQNNILTVQKRKTIPARNRKPVKIVKSFKKIHVDIFYKDSSASFRFFQGRDNKIFIISEHRFSVKDGILFKWILLISTLIFSFITGIYLYDRNSHNYAVRFDRARPPPYGRYNILRQPVKLLF